MNKTHATISVHGKNLVYKLFPETENITYKNIKDMKLDTNIQVHIKITKSKIINILQDKLCPLACIRDTVQKGCVKGYLCVSYYHETCHKI